MTPTEDLYNRLNRIVQYYNKDLFSGALPPLVLTLQRNQKSIATFDPDRWGKGDGDIAHELSINSSVVTGLPLIELFKVVVHHMTICWQHVYGNPSRKGYCNKELANKLIEIGLQPTSTGMPGGAQVGQNIQSYPIVGGRFLISSCRLLDTEKWRMSWVDLEVREPGTNALSWMDNFSAAASYDDQIAVLVKAMPDANIETLKSLTTFRLKEIVAESALRSRKPAPSANPPQYNRSKTAYRCSCGQRLWGKPGLDVTCNKCETRFEELNKPSQPPSP